MEISERRLGSLVVLRPEGRIDNTTCAEFQARLLAIVNEGTGDIVVDFSAVDYISSVGLRAHIFVPATAPEAKVAQLLIFGADVLLVEGSYDDAYELCMKACAEFGWFNRNCAINPYLVEGKKTVGLEIAEQLGWQVPDTILVPTGDGCL